MRSFVLALGFWLLIFNISLVPVAAGGVLDKDILFRPASVTIDGDAIENCWGTMSINISGYIEYYLAGYGRFVFSAQYFPGADKVAEVDGDVLEVHTGGVDLVMEMKAPILRNDDSGTLYFRYEPNYVYEPKSDFPDHADKTASCMSKSGSDVSRLDK